MKYRIDCESGSSQLLHGFILYLFSTVRHESLCLQQCVQTPYFELTLMLTRLGLRNV